MKTTIRSAILAAAVAAVPVLGLTSAASAQNRINTSGVLDANNRVGSGGNNPNDPDKRGAATPVNGNDIVTGNVSGGKQFRGQIQYTDPRAFRGNTSDRNLDNFVRSSSGVDSRLADTVQPFYGSGRGVAPPPGFTQSGYGTGAFVPEGQTVNRDPGDLRIGAINLAQPSISLPSPGELLMPGPVDPSSGQTYIAASPLTGIRQFNPTETTGFGATSTQYNPVTNQLDQNAVQKMRDELNRAAGIPTETPAGKQQQQQQQQQDNQQNNGSTNNGNNLAPGTAPQVPGATPIVAQPIQQPGTGAQAINTAVTAQAGDLGTDQGVRNRQVGQIPPPEKQSALYAQLLQKHEQAVNDKSISDEEAARQFNQLQMAAKQNPGQPAAPSAAAAQPGQPGAQQPTANVPPGTPPGAAAPVPAPGANAKPAAPSDQTVAGTPDYVKRNEELIKQGATKIEEQQKKLKKQEPVKVPSLATGMKGKGLEQIMREAEDLMKQGKFTSALDRYDQAEAVANNNPLIKLGRAHAELGAEYYARAEAHLRDVFNKNPALLNGQYDLASMIGEQRLQLLVRDLKEIANRDQKDARAVFLLGYIAYNTGHEQNAEGYIDLADKRSGGTDPFYKLLRDNWALPGGATTQPAPAATPEMNK